MRSNLVAALAALIVGCGQASNDLWGSIDESFPLEFDYVRVLMQDLALRVEYIKDLPGGSDKICKVIVNTGEAEIQDDTELQDEYFLSYTVTVQRSAATGGDFPDYESGVIKFDKYRFRDNGKIDGSFAVEFVNGRNLLGNFDGRIQVVSTE
jgi:hypothetical protein